MSHGVREGFFKWLPTMITLAGQFILFGVFYGQTMTEIKHLQASDVAIRAEVMPMPERMRVFVPRTEFAIEVSNLQREIREIKEITSGTNKKLDDFFRQSTR